MADEWDTKGEELATRIRRHNYLSGQGGAWEMAAGALKEAFEAGFEHAVKHVEQHCCVSSCCDAQPGSGEAAELARCLRKNRDVGR